MISGAGPDARGFLIHVPCLASLRPNRGWELRFRAFLSFDKPQPVGVKEAIRITGEMKDLTDLELEKMSVKELQDLKDQVHVAIRAQIRKRAEMKAAPPAPKAAPVPLDLERERDAWMASRKSGLK